MASSSSNSGVLERFKTSFNFSKADEESLTNAVLIVEGKSVHVNKDEIPLGDDLKHREFVEFLHVIYPSRKKIADENVAAVLKLADRFAVQSVVKECEAFLCNANHIPTRQRLLLADKHHLSDLQSTCLDKLDTKEKIRQLTKTEEFDSFSPNLKNLILQKAFHMFSHKVKVENLAEKAMKKFRDLTQ